MKFFLNMMYVIGIALIAVSFALFSTLVASVFFGPITSVLPGSDNPIWAFRALVVGGNLVLLRAARAMGTKKTVGRIGFLMFVFAVNILVCFLAFCVHAMGSDFNDGVAWLIYGVLVPIFLVRYCFALSGKKFAVRLEDSGIRESLGYTR